MGKILLYETTVTYFLRQTIAYLKKWKQLPVLQMETNKEYAENLEALADSVFEMLPEYCYGVLGLLNNILYEKNTWEEKQKIMEGTICICNFLLERPSVETFEWLVDWNYSTLISDERFSEELLEDILKRAWKLQLKYETRLRHTTSMQEWKKYQKKLYENDILWIALVRMRTITESILLKAIRYSKLGTWNFYRFCLEIAGNPKTTEKVWIALIERIQKEKFSNFSRKKAKARKTRIITSMFQIKYPGPQVVKRAIELITPAGKYYYDFYSAIILKCRREKAVLQAIHNKVGEKKMILGGPMRYKEKRLQLLLNNLS